MSVIILFLFFITGCFPEINDEKLDFKEYQDSQLRRQLNPEICGPCDRCRMGKYLMFEIFYQNNVDECNSVYGWPRDYEHPIDPEKEDELEISCKRAFTGEIIHDYYRFKTSGFFYFFNYQCKEQYKFCCPEAGGP